MITKRRALFNSKQKIILQLLNKSRAGFTIYEISQQTGISWITVRKYLKEFVDRGVVVPISAGGKDEYS